MVHIFHLRKEQLPHKHLYKAYQLDFEIDLFFVHLECFQPHKTAALWHLVTLPS